MLKRSFWAAALGLLSQSAGAQTPTSYPVMGQSGMPGVAVGTGIVPPAGTPISRATPNVGQRVGTGPGGIPSLVNPQIPRPEGQMIDLKNVIAPYPQMPTPPKSFWEKLEERWFAMFEAETPDLTAPNWTPGLSRRNRDRARERREIPWWAR